MSFQLGVTLGMKKAVLILADRKQVSVKELYTPLELYSLDREVVGKKIEEVFRDHKLIKRKPLYNQVGRPAKNLKIHPKIIINITEGGEELVEGLRHKKIPVEAVRFTDCAEWNKKSYGRALGYDYFVPESEFLESINCVSMEKRVEFSNGFEKRWGLLKMIDSNRYDSFQKYGEKEDMVKALSMILWFRENVRYGRVYVA